MRAGGPADLDMTYRHSNVGRARSWPRAALRCAPAPVDEIEATVREMQARRRGGPAAQGADVRRRCSRIPTRRHGAGRLLEACGLKGFAIGGARISPVHANFIENIGDATSADVAALIGEARRRARERFGVELEHEVELLGPISLDD